MSKERKKSNQDGEGTTPPDPLLLIYAPGNRDIETLMFAMLTEVRKGLLSLAEGILICRSAGRILRDREGKCQYGKNWKR